jgi:ATP-dependent Clp protease ATP-binding subunit ClpX
VVLSEVDQKKSVKESQEAAAEVKPGQFKKAPPPPQKVYNYHEQHWKMCVYSDRNIIFRYMNIWITMWLVKNGQKKVLSVAVYNHY